jgi:hypothetical protein
MSLDLVKLEHDLLEDFTKGDIKAKILERIKAFKFDDISKYKNDNQLLKVVCNMIEHLVTKKDNIDKLELCVEIFKILYGNLTEDEITTIKRNVNFIWKNKLIKKISEYRLFKTSFLEWFSKKQEK